MPSFFNKLTPQETVLLKYVRFLVLTGLVSAALAVIHLLSGNQYVSAHEVLVGAISAFLLSITEAIYSWRNLITPPTSDTAPTPATPLPSETPHSPPLG